MTLVWGVVFVSEFLTRVALVYTTPAAAVLAFAPIVTGVLTVGTVVWTFRYAGSARKRISG